MARPSLPCSVPTSLIQDASSRTLAPRALPIVPPSNECAWPATPMDTAFWVARMGVDGPVGAVV